MKFRIRYILLFFILLFPAFLDAQESVLTLGSKLERVQSDPLTGLNIDKIGKDRSNRPCARIKLHVNRMTPAEIKELQLKPIGGNAIVMKSVPAVEGNGIIVEMTALKPVRFFLHHPKYGDSNPVSVELEGNVEYRMEAWCNFLQTIVVSCPRAGASVWLDNSFKGLVSHENNALPIEDVLSGRHQLKVSYGDDKAEMEINVHESNVFFTVNLESAASLQQYVLFKLDPQDALVTLDGDILASDGFGNASRLVRYGIHKYLVEAKGFHSIEGEFSLNASNAQKTLEIPVSLKPAFGYLNLSGKRIEGARVYVDKEFKGTVPLDPIRLSSGIHRLNLVKPLYRDYSVSFNIHDGLTETLSPVMAEDFSHLTFEAPDNAFIYINDELKGAGVWSGDLPSGIYQIRTELEHHRPSLREITVVPGMSREPIRLQAPVPITGALSVESSPAEAGIYIDGIRKGTTPSFFTDILVGKRIVRIVKDGFIDKEQVIEIKEAETATLKVALDSVRKVRFNCVQYGAALYIDGKYVGSASGEYGLSFGKHEIQIRLEGYKTHIEHITVDKDYDLSVNVTLLRKGDSGVLQPEIHSGHHSTEAPSKVKPVKKKNNWFDRAKVNRPLGFNMSCGFDYESNYVFKENSYGLKLLYSIGDYTNRFNVEAGLRMQFWQDMASDYSGTDSLPLQWRIVAVPKYNIIRKSTSIPFYVYTAAELSLNIMGKENVSVNPVNFSTALRIGVGFRNYDFSAYWLYDVSPMYTSAVDPAFYHRSRLGLSVSFYFF